MRRNLYLMYAISLLQGMVFYGPIATLYREAAGLSFFQISTIESISLVLGILLEVPWGYVADRIGYRKTIIACSGLYLISKVVFWQASGFTGFLLERVILAVVISGFSGVDASFIYLSSAKGESQRAFGVYTAMGMIGLMFAAVMYSLVVGANYRLSALLTVVSYAAAALLSLFLKDVDHGEGSERGFCISMRAAVVGLSRSKKRMLLLVGAAFLVESHQVITVFLNQLQFARAGLSPSMMGLVYIASSLFGLCGVWSQRLTGRLGTRPSIVAFALVPAASCAVMASTAAPIPAVAGVLLVRMSNAFFLPFQMEEQNRMVEGSSRATELSLNAMVMDCLAVGINLAFGVFSEWGVEAALLFGCALFAIGGTLLMQAFPAKA